MLTAHALKAAGLSARIIDPKPDAKPLDGRAYALAATSVSMLRTLNLWAAVAPKAQPINDIKVSDGTAGEGAHPWFLHFDHTEIEEGPLGAMVEDTTLRAALQGGIEIEQGEVTAQSITPGHATLTLASGKTLAARLIIACDGRFSPTATRAKIKRQGWTYDQKSLVATLGHAQPHQGIAHQMFMASGPLAILPLTGNRSSIVWTETTESAAQIETLNDPAFLTATRLACRSQKASSPPASPWSATPPTASTRLQAKASIWASAISPHSPKPWPRPSAGAKI